MEKAGHNEGKPRMERGKPILGCFVFDDSSRGGICRKDGFGKMRQAHQVIRQHDSFVVKEEAKKLS
jgi:hypothetical protein